MTDQESGGNQSEPETMDTSVDFAEAKQVLFDGVRGTASKIDRDIQIYCRRSPQ